MTTRYGSHAKHANYKGDVTHIIGEEFYSPRLKRNGDVAICRWVATDATYDSERNMTTVEFDRL